MTENKYLDYEGLSQLWNLIMNHLDNKLFIGTREDYEIKNANNDIPSGCLIVLLDENDSEKEEEE